MQTVFSSAEPFLPFGALSIDKTRYAFFGLSDSAGNTGAQWLDESGKANHFTTPAPFALVADSSGQTVFRASDESGAFFNTPLASP
ncbi:hypothetical protein, partial [Hymenobacter lapidiphilus]